ncbi:MAG: hypothetical protein ACLTYN_05045 [Dysosmobacter welbionis]
MDGAESVPMIYRYDNLLVTQTVKSGPWPAVGWATEGSPELIAD